MKKFNGTESIAIDSNVLSYYVTATEPGYNPCENKEEPKNEIIASLQIPLYSRWYAILPTIREEYLKIKKTSKLELHIIADKVFIEYTEPAFDKAELKKKAEYFNQYHQGAKNYNDCMLVAEAEFLSDTTVLLSNDRNLLKKLSPLVKGLLIMKPTEFVKNYDLLKERLRISPAKSNYLYHQTWWRF
jgi:hypothetical protein